MDLVGNSGSFRLYEGDREITIDLDGIEEMTASSSTEGSNSIGSISGWPWVELQNPDCDGSGDETQDTCIHVSADTEIDLGGIMTQIGMDVRLYNTDLKFGDVHVGQGNLKFDIFVNEWPSMPGNTIDFLFDISSQPSNGPSDGFIDYLTSFTQCCCGVCAESSNINVTNRNWRKQTLSFGTCDNGCATTIIYDPIVGFSRPSEAGHNWMVPMVVSGGLAVLAMGYCVFTKNKNGSSEANYSML